MKKYICMVFAMLAGVMLLLSGCGKASHSDSVTEAIDNEPVVALSVFKNVPRPETVIPIPQLRTQVRPGDEVIVEAKVGGVLEPFVEGRAVFVVSDEATVVTCEVLGDDDHCETPWDACCEDPDNIRAGSASIQVVSEDGAVLKQSVRGMNGLKELSRVRVAGIVNKQSNEQVLIIDATAIDVL